MGRLWYMYVFFPYLSYLSHSGAVKLTMTCMRESQGSIPSGSKTILVSFLFLFFSFFLHVYFNVLEVSWAYPPHEIQSFVTVFPRLIIKYLPIRLLQFANKIIKNNKILKRNMGRFSKNVFKCLHTWQIWKHLCKEKTVLIFKSCTGFQATHGRG